MSLIGNSESKFVSSDCLCLKILDGLVVLGLILNFLISMIMFFEFERIVLVARLSPAEAEALLEDSATALIIFFLELSSASKYEFPSKL